MHTIKGKESISSAYFDYGVKSFSLDSKDELSKILEATDQAKDLELFVRIAISNEHSEIDLSRKFGALPSEALGLVRLCKEHSKKLGISFHVGSQCMHKISYSKGIREIGNIIKKTKEGDLILHVKSNNQWSDRLYDSTLLVVGSDKTLDWSIRIDGPYGSSSQDLLHTSHAILVGAGHGISRIAPILQDIVIRLKNGSDLGRLKKVDLYWLIEDRNYFEWFTKMLKEMDEGGSPKFFNYHIYFLERSPEEISRKMMYISTDVLESETNIDLVDNLWSCLLYTSPSPRDRQKCRMPSSA